MIPGAFGSEIIKIPPMDEVLRRHSLDRLLIFGESHLRRVLASYAAYYNQARTHLALGKAILSGLHHQYVQI